MASTAVLQGKFVTGSTLKHVFNMTVAISIGLIAIFAAGLLKVFYILLLDQRIDSCARLRRYGAACFAVARDRLVNIR